MLRSLWRSIGLGGEDTPPPQPQAQERTRSAVPEDPEKKAKKLAEDFQTFSDQSILKGGAMLMEYDPTYKNGCGLGRLVYGQVDIPIGIKFKTPNGNFVERIDICTIMVEDKKIEIPKEISQKQKSETLQKIEEARKNGRTEVQKYSTKIRNKCYFY